MRQATADGGADLEAQRDPAIEASFGVTGNGLSKTDGAPNPAGQISGTARARRHGPPPWLYNAQRLDAARAPTAHGAAHQTVHERNAPWMA
jgi:hypothetical protein